MILWAQRLCRLRIRYDCAYLPADEFAESFIRFRIQDDVIVCESDPNELASSKVAGDLIRQGYRASTLKGGIADWLGANLPTETKEAPKQAAPEPGALKG